MTTLDELPELELNKTAPLRLPILSKYKDLGCVIEGKVEQGTIKPGDKLCVMPNKVPVEVLNVWLDQDEVGYLVGGENARVLTDISDEDPAALAPRCAPTHPPFRPPAARPRSSALAPPRASHRVAPPPSAGPTKSAHKRFEVQLIVVELLEHKSIFSAGYTAILHVAAAAECSIVELTSEIDKKSGKKSKKKPMFTRAVRRARTLAQFGAILRNFDGLFSPLQALFMCVIETEQNVCLEPFDQCPQLGRPCCATSATIGIGKVSPPASETPARWDLHHPLP